MAEDRLLLAIHAILDMVVAYDEDATKEANERAVQTAFARLNEIEAVTGTLDGETDVVTLDATPLLTAVGVTFDTLLRELAIKLDKDRLTLLRTVRGHLDRVFRDDGGAGGT